jgi:hypothetical protein
MRNRTDSNRGSGTTRRNSRSPRLRRRLRIILIRSAGAGTYDIPSGSQCHTVTRYKPGCNDRWRTGGGADVGTLIEPTGSPVSHETDVSGFSTRGSQSQSIDWLVSQIASEWRILYSTTDQSVGIGPQRAAPSDRCELAWAARAGGPERRNGEGETGLSDVLCQAPLARLGRSSRSPA